MIEYSEVERGDILRLGGAGAPGWSELGDLVRVLRRKKLGVRVEDKHGEPMEFVFNCGAARLEATEWRDDFPAEPPDEAPTPPQGADGRET